MNTDLPWLDAEVEAEGKYYWVTVDRSAVLQKGRGVFDYTRDLIQDTVKANGPFERITFYEDPNNLSLKIVFEK